jgi:outer membrane protein OmpA-like peptidoglycan-associated protein
VKGVVVKKSFLAAVTLIGLLSYGLTGCATKSYVQDQIDKGVESKVSELRKQVEANQAEIIDLRRSDEEFNDRLGTISGTAQEALTRAENAGKLARGKLLYEATLADESVHFAYNRSDLSVLATEALDAFALRMKEENKNIYIEIQGHTDSFGSEGFNLKLGADRATAVMNYLHERHNIPLHRMSIFSYGESRPIADNKTPGNRAKNRRVTLMVLE